MKPIVPNVGIEHMGGRETIEVGPGGNEYTIRKSVPKRRSLAT